MDVAVSRSVLPSPRKLAVVVALEAVVVGGSAAVAHVQPGARPLDALGVLLLLIAGGAVWLAPGRAWPALLTTLAATAAYSALGYQMQGPAFLGIIATLAAVADPARPRRSLQMGTVAIAVFLARQLAQLGAAALDPGTFAAVSWMVMALLLGHAVRGHRAYMASMEERARRAEATREAEAVRRVVEERMRIARELHDVVSHSISVINVQSGVASYVLDTQPEAAREALLTIKATSKEALQEMRAILDVLRGVDEPEEREPAPRLAQLDALIERTCRAGLPATLTVDGNVRPLAPTVDLAAYRIVQEALTNALRYAGPATAHVTLHYGPDRLEIGVCDDGGGLVAAPNGNGGHGLIGMRERAAAVDGTLEAGAAPGGGFRVRACLPLARNA